MKRAYSKPTMCWQPVRSSRAVADVCWAYANNTQPFYYNTYGAGYAELYIVDSRCDKNVKFEIRYYPEDLSAAERAAADADMARVIAEVRATMPNKPNNYKGSVFQPDIDPSWS